MSLTMSTIVSLIAVILGTVDCLEPQLRVNPTVISVRDSVHLSCEPPQDLHGPQTKCRFLTHTDRVTKDSDCEVSFTGAELIRLGGYRPDSEIYIYCVYLLDTGGSSPHSIPVKVTVTALKPQLRVNPTVISVRDSVHLSCEPPQGLHGPQTKCRFLTHTDRVTKDSDCEVSFTGAELIRLGGYRPDSEIYIYCVYLLDTGGSSPHSIPVKVTVTGLEPQLRVNPTVISVRDSAHLSCEPPQDLHGPQIKCTFLTNTDRVIKKDSECNVSVTGTDLIGLGGYNVDYEINISCLYTVDSRQDSMFSDFMKITFSEKDPTPTEPSSPPPENRVVPLVITAVVVTLLGLAAVCLFRVRRKKNSPSEKEAPPPNNIYYEVMFTGESKKPEEARSKSAHNETYSMTGDSSSAVLPLPPTGCDVKPEQRNNNKSNLDNIYFTIEDPPATVQSGTIYSTVAMH